MKKTKPWGAVKYSHIFNDISHDFSLRGRENGVDDDILRRGVSFAVTCGARSPPPERGSGQGSAENSFNDSNSTTQSNVTSECSEAECDREPLVKQRGDHSL